MRMQPMVYGILVVVVFRGPIGVAQATGNWTTSGRVTASGERVAPTGTDPAEINGWMTLAQVSTAYEVPVAEILGAFALPADTPATTAIKDLESDTFSVTTLRTWLAAGAGP